MLTWVDGAPAAQLPLTDRGLAYGDGLFETIAVRGGTARLLSRHLSRLSAGLQRLSITLDLAVVEAELRVFCRELDDGVAKLMITRGDGLRGYAPPQPACPRRVMLGNSYPIYPDSHAEQGVRLFPCSTRLAEQPLLAGLKHLNRLEQVLARSEWQDAAFAEGLMRDVSGRVIEGVFSNLFLVREGVLWTPELSRCGVAGVMRAEVLDLAQGQGISVRIGDVGYDDLLAADEVFLCNSLYGIWPVRELAASVWPVGPLTRKLQGLVRSLLDS